MEHGRRSTRLQTFDYTQSGAYFVTICSYHRKPIFGQIQDGIILPSEIGKIIGHEWERSESIRSEIRLDCWVLMPNHLHGIVWIVEDSIEGVGATGRSPLRPKERASGPVKRSLGAFIAGFKAASTTEVRKALGSKFQPIWQRNYYDHVIRDDHDLNHYRNYIDNNPIRWTLDRYYVTI